MRESSGTSSTRKRGSLSRVSVNSGFSIPTRPTSARYCTSSSDIGETPHGRYLSSQGNSLSRLDPSTSQIRKWVSSRIVTVFFERPTRGLGLPLASSNSTGQPDRHREPVGDVYSQEIAASILGLFCPPCVKRASAPSAPGQRLPRQRLRQALETNFSSPQRRLVFSYVQCTT